MYLLKVFSMEFLDELWQQVGSLESLNEAINLLLSILDIEQNEGGATFNDSKSIFEIGTSVV